MSAPDNQEDLAAPVHLYTNISRVPLSKEELDLKTQRIRRNFNAGFTELEEVLLYHEWRANPQKYDSFHDYCRKEFEFSGRTGYLKVAAQKVNNVLMDAGLPPLKERLAHVVSGLEPEQIVEVVTRGKEISDNKNRSGKAALFHTPGKLSARIMQEARALVVPDAPAPKDAPLVAPLPPKKRLEIQPLEIPVVCYDSRMALNRYGRVYRFSIEGKFYTIEVSAADFAPFFSETFQAPGEADPDIFSE